MPVSADWAVVAERCVADHGDEWAGFNQPSFLESLKSNVGGRVEAGDVLFDLYSDHDDSLRN